MFKRLPWLKVLVVAEIALLARDHMLRLSTEERKRMLELVRTHRGRARNLSPVEQDELAALVAKAEPRLFAGTVADKLSPFPLPKRIIRGPKRR
jgi:hypothetical protein